MPRRTAAAARSGSAGIEGLTRADADARLELAVTAHNAEVLDSLRMEGGDAPPDGLVRLLATMSDRWRGAAD
jgi:hypothetical protein